MNDEGKQQSPPTTHHLPHSATLDLQRPPHLVKHWGILLAQIKPQTLQKQGFGLEFCSPFFQLLDWGARKHFLQETVQCSSSSDAPVGLTQSDSGRSERMMTVIAQQASRWPDGYDRALTSIYLAVIVGLPLLGYVFMVVDFRRYLRSLRRALVVVASAVPRTPYWALRSRPTCLQALGLELPCTEEEVLAAYRELAKTMHPDRGGELAGFLQLQRYFEQALSLVRQEEEMAHAEATP